MIAEVVATPVANAESIRFLLATGVEYTFQSLLSRIQADFNLTLHQADSLIWSGAGEFWTINQSTGRITLMVS